MEIFFPKTGISLFSFLLPLPPPPLNLHGGGGVPGKGRVVLVVFNLGQLDFSPPTLFSI